MCCEPARGQAQLRPTASSSRTDGITKGRPLPVLRRGGRHDSSPHLKDRPFTMKAVARGVCPAARSSRSRAPKGHPGLDSPRGQFSARGRVAGRASSRLVDFSTRQTRARRCSGMVADALHRHETRGTRASDKPGTAPRLGALRSRPARGGGVPTRCACGFAHYVHEALGELGLESYVKTSGADGIHVLVSDRPPLDLRGTPTSSPSLLSRQARGGRQSGRGGTTEWLKKKRGGACSSTIARNGARQGQSRRPTRCGRNPGAPVVGRR